MNNPVYPPSAVPNVQRPKSGFGNFLSNNSNMLTAMGLGMLSGRGPEAYMRSMQGALAGSQLDNQNRDARQAEAEQKAADQRHRAMAD